MIKKQIEFYKQHRALFQQGDFYSLPMEQGQHQNAWMVISADRQEAIVGYFQGLQRSNPSLQTLKLPLLSPNTQYQINIREQFHNIRQFGDLVNKELPVTIKDRGLLHGMVANHVLHPVTAESYILYGDQLSLVGIPLKSQFTGTEMSEHVSHLGDFGSRLYHIKAI